MQHPGTAVCTSAMAVARPAAGWVAGRPWAAPDARAARRFATVLDVQVTLGLLLYGVLSSVTRAAFTGVGRGSNEVCSHRRRRPAAQFPHP